MTTPNPNAQTAPQQTQAPAGGNSGQMDYQAAYTEVMARIQSGELLDKKVYTGLQQKYQQEYDAHQATKQALTSTTQELSGFQAQLSSLNQVVTSAQTEKTTVQQQLAEAQSRIARFELIGKDFPELISWEAQGLLPNGPLDKLPDTLKLISGQLQQKEVQTKQNVLAGSSAINTTAQTATTVTAAAKLQEYNTMVLHPNGKTRKELDAVWAEYQALKAQESK